MSRNFSQHERILEILSSGEWITGEQFVYQYRLTKFASRIGEILDDKQRWPDIEIEFGWDGKWRKYRLKRPEAKQAMLFPQTNYFYK